MTLIAAPGYQHGDFDFDGDVDGADFLAWQRGGSPNPLSRSDLADWQANFSKVASLAAATSTTVPEPSSSIMFALAAFLCSLPRAPGAARK